MALKNYIFVALDDLSEILNLVDNFNILDFEAKLNKSGFCWRVDASSHFGKYL